MARPDELAAQQRRALDRVAPLVEKLSLYLAGGSALAFHLAHRVSRDLDLFGLAQDLDLERVRREFAALPTTEVDSLTDAALHLRVDDVPIDIVRYPYPLLNAPCEGPAGVATASLVDLAAMKLSAASRRGIRRDFWDLYEIFRRGTPSLNQALESYLRRYGLQESDLYHVLKALTYFDDAEADALMPMGLTSEKWEQIKAWFIEHVRDELRARVT